MKYKFMTERPQGQVLVKDTNTTATTLKVAAVFLPYYQGGETAPFFKRSEFMKVLIAMPTAKLLSSNVCFDIYLGTSDIETSFVALKDIVLILQEHACKRSKNQKADYILWVDSDMILPEDTLKSCYPTTRILFPALMPSRTYSRRI